LNILPDTKELQSISETNLVLQKAKQIINSASDTVNKAFNGQKDLNQVITAVVETAKFAIQKGSLYNIEAKEEQNIAKAIITEQKTQEIISNISAIKQYTEDMSKQIKNLGIDKALEPSIDIRLEIKKEVKSKEVELPDKFVAQIDEKIIKRINIDKGDIILSIPTQNVKGGKEPIKLITEKKEKQEFEEKVRRLFGETTKSIYSFTMRDGNKLRDKFEKTIEVRIRYKPKQGEDVNKITVFFVDKNGNKENIGCVYDGFREELIFSTNHFSTFAVEENKVAFSDVKDSFWAKKDIEALAAKGIIKGKGNSFEPDAKITRAEFAALLVRAFKLDIGEVRNEFKDVEDSSWYAKEIAFAKKSGIVKGVSDDKFNPEGNISRQDMAVMVSRAMEKFKGYSNSGQNFVFINRFDDKNNIADYAKQHAAFAVKYGIIKGVNDKKFAPDEYATRAQAAAMIYRLISIE